MNKQDLLKLNLQFFAEDDNDNETNIDEKNPSDETLNTEEQEKEVVDKKIPYDRFKAKVDEVNELKARLAEIEQAQAEAERKELEEKEEYKTLYEQAKAEAEQAKQEALSIKKNALLIQAGYGEEQAKLLVKLVEGDDDESIAESIKLLQATIPVKDAYADPSPLNSAKEKPETVGADDVGAKMFERIKNKIF